MGGLSRAEGYHSHIRIWGPHDLFWHFIKHKVPVGQYVMTVPYVVKYFLWTWTWVAMICRPTQSLSFSCPPSCSLTHSLSLDFSLLFPCLSLGVSFSFWRGVLKDLWWCICHHSSWRRARDWTNLSYPQVPGSIPAETLSTQTNMDLSK